MPPTPVTGDNPPQRRCLLLPWTAAAGAIPKPAALPSFLDGRPRPVTPSLTEPPPPDQPKTERAHVPADNLTSPRPRCQCRNLMDHVKHVNGQPRHLRLFSPPFRPRRQPVTDHALLEPPPHRQPRALVNLFSWWPPTPLRPPTAAGAILRSTALPSSIPGISCLFLARRR